MSAQPKQTRITNPPAFVPNTVTRARYIIRTRAQAQHLTRQPLCDALTNSPTKTSSKDRLRVSPVFQPAHMQRKRALSPHEGRDLPDPKRLKPLVLSDTPVFHIPAQIPAIQESQPPRLHLSHQLSGSHVPSETPVPSTSLPASSSSFSPYPPPASPTMVISLPEVDVFNPTSFDPHPSSSLTASGSQGITYTENARQLPGPRFADVSMRIDDGDDGYSASKPSGPSSQTLRHKFSMASLSDDTMLLDSPSKAKLPTALPAGLPAVKVSLIPRRILPLSLHPSAPTSAVTSWPSQPSSHAGDLNIRQPFPPAATNTSILVSRSPPKRSLSSETRSPTRPSARPTLTSGGSLNSRRQSSIHTSTQVSLSNLELALEKLSIPRIRASLGVGNMEPTSQISRGPVAPLDVSKTQSLASSSSLGASRLSKPPLGALGSSRTASGRTTGGSGRGKLPSRPALNSGTFSRMGLGRPLRQPAFPPIARVRSAMGPPPAPSAAAVAAQASSSTASSLLTRPSNLPTSTSPNAAMGISRTQTVVVSPEVDQNTPAHAVTAGTASVEDRRKRRASIALRSLIDPSNCLIVSALPPLSNDTSPAIAGPITGTSIAGGSVENKAKNLTILRECVVFVDVKTDDGSEAGELFVNMLKGLGARIMTRITPSITHIIFKSGSPTTLTKHKLFDDPKPFLIGIGWIVECVEKREKVDEMPFLVDEPEPVVSGSKRRKSMVPSMLPGVARRSIDFRPPLPPHLSPMKEEEFEGITMVASSSPPEISTTPQNTIPPLERARQKNQTYTPKISSPLKATFKPSDVDENGIGQGPQSRALYPIFAIARQTRHPSR